MRRMVHSKTCARCRRAFGDMQIRKCPNETVNQVLGEYICYFCCKRCHFHTEEPFCGAIGCGYHHTGN